MAFDESEVRRKVTGLVRSVLVARLRDQPDYLAQAREQGWDFPDYKTDRRALPRLLRDADRLWKKFSDKFEFGQDSIPSPEEEGQEDNASKAVSLAFDLLTGDLGEAARIAASGRAVDWESLAAWNSLRDIRAAVNHLAQEKSSGDGPHELSFRHGGKDYEMPRAQPTRLIRFLWDRERRKCELSDLAAPVFVERNLDATDIKARFRSTRSRVNKFFKTHGIPFQIKLNDRVVELIDDP